MKLPALVPEKLHYTQAAKNDQILADILIRNPSDLITFIEYACEDQTWSGRHETFMQNVLLWLTNQFFQDRLSMEFGKRVANAIKPHYQFHKKFIPLNISIEYNGSEIGGNSLMWGASSDYLRTYIRQECRSANNKVLTLENIPQPLFENIDEYIHTGDVSHLVYKSQSEVLELLKVAERLGLTELSELCEWSLHRYISDNNFTELIILAHEKGYETLKNECYEFVNKLGFGVKFRSGSVHHLHMEFLHYQRTSRRIFGQLKDYLTHLSFPKNLSEDEEFSELVHSCSNLIGIDLSGSTSFSDRLYDMPSDLKELDLSMCEWLTDENFRTIIEICPKLESVSIASNTQLGYITFSELHKLSQLKSLNASRCVQINDADIQVITNACPGLLRLFLESCTSIGEAGFLDIARSLTDLLIIDLTRTLVTDYPLVEFAVNCPNVSEIYLTRCEGLTEKGIMEFTRIASSLKVLDIRLCQISEHVFHELKVIGSTVSILYE